MASTPRKRAADEDWETPSVKTLRRTRSTVSGPSTLRGATFRVAPQSARQPLAHLQQPRHHQAAPPSATQSKSGQSTSSSLPLESILEPRPIICSSSCTAPARQPPHPQHHVAPGHHTRAGPSHPSPPQSTSTPTGGVPYKPAVRHGPHRKSNLCQNFHSVPYPLGLLPFDSWFTLHHKPNPAQSRSVLCPACMTLQKPTPHARKLFLVAERLSYEDGITSTHDKSLNEELNWAVNYELGILDPFVEDPQQVPGGKHSRSNTFYPYVNEHEMILAFKYVFIAEDITEPTWALWIGAQLDLEKMLGGRGDEAAPSKPSFRDDGLKILESGSARLKREVDTIDLTDEAPSPPKCSVSLGPPTPPSAFQTTRTKTDLTDTTKHVKPSVLNDRKDSMAAPTPPPYFNHQRRIVSYKTLQDFYELLDRIERTSYVGAIFLEAYAEKLRDDICKACWLKRNVNLDVY